MSTLADPFDSYQFPYDGSRFAHLFAGADTFQAVDEAWYAAQPAEGWVEAEQLKVAAVTRSRELRVRQPATVSSTLPSRSEFALCQNDVELTAMRDLVLEDATGMNVAFMQIQKRDALFRRKELLEEGVVRGPSPF